MKFTNLTGALVATILVATPIHAQQPRSSNDSFTNLFGGTYSPEQAAKFKAERAAAKAREIKHLDDIIVRYQGIITDSEKWIKEDSTMILNTWDAYVKAGKVSKTQAEAEKAKVLEGNAIHEQTILRAKKQIAKYQVEKAQIK